MLRPVVLALAVVVAVGCSGGGPAPGDGAADEPVTAASASVEGADAAQPVPAGCPQPPALAAEDGFFGDARLDMVATQIEARGIDDPDVLGAMRAVPRHRFVPDDVIDFAYSDGPLPIGYGQTISQPQIVALMTQLLELEPCDRVLEIGTGSGYQAAVLAQLGVEVFTIEIIPELAERAESTLDDLGYPVTVRQADGYAGWEEHGPFDAIIVTAAPDHVPQPLVDQLAAGGRLVIPIGPVGAVQTMWQFTLDAEGELIGENFGAVRFVPFTRDS